MRKQPRTALVKDLGKAAKLCVCVLAEELALAGEHPCAASEILHDVTRKGQLHAAYLPLKAYLEALGIVRPSQLVGKLA